MSERYFEPGKYYPAPPLPRWVAAELKRIGGRNPYGKPMLQIVWGMDARWMRYGRLVPKYPGVKIVEQTLDTSGKVAKVIEEEAYLGVPLWFIEEWVSPEVLCPVVMDELGNKRNLWEERRYHVDPGTGLIEDVIGPPPLRGEYRYLCKLQSPTGDFVEPSHPLFEMIEKAYWMRRNGPPRNLDKEYADAVDFIKQNRSKKINELFLDAAEETEIVDNVIRNPHRARRGGTGKRVFYRKNKPFINGSMNKTQEAK